MKLRIAALTLILAAHYPTVATATECSAYMDIRQNAEHVKELYYYALITEAADTGALPRWACEVPDRDDLRAPHVYTRAPQTAAATSTDWNRFADDSLRLCGSDTEPPCIRPLTRADLLAGNSEWWQQIVNEFEQDGRYVGAYEPPNGGPAYLVCDRDPEDVSALLMLSQYQVPVDEGDLRQWIIRPILWIVETAAIDGAVETVTLQKTNNLSADPYPETLTAIRGTRPDRLSQWRTTLNKLRGKSCGFDLMVKVAGYFMGEEHSKYAMTGHSLGGAIAQHVGQHYSQSGADQGFRAFSFNALGTDAQADPAILQSFVIDGDPVPAIGARIDQTQAGRVVRFTPPDTDDWRNPLDPLDRHLLSSVQRALCHCMKGRGSLTVNPAYPKR